MLLPAARGLDIPHGAEDAGEVPPAAAGAGVEEAQDELLAEGRGCTRTSCSTRLTGTGASTSRDRSRLSSAACSSTCITNSSRGVSTWSFNNLHMDNRQFKMDKLDKWYFENVF